MKEDERIHLAADEAANQIVERAKIEARSIVSLSRAQRRRTVITSIICSGLLGLFIGHAIEIEVDNNGVERSRKNCRLIQDDRRDIYRSLKIQSDRILGSEDGKVKPLKIKGTAFEEFEALMKSNAKALRKRSKEYQKRVQNCNKEFEKRKTFFVF